MNISGLRDKVAPKWNVVFWKQFFNQGPTWFLGANVGRINLFFRRTSWCWDQLQWRCGSFSSYQMDLFRHFWASTTQTKNRWFLFVKQTCYCQWVVPLPGKGDNPTLSGPPPPPRTSHHRFTKKIHVALVKIASSARHGSEACCNA